MVYFDKGYIGCFEMVSKDSGKDQLKKYIRQLTDAGHKRIIAPINGSTWHQYRLVSWTNGDPPFPLEPQNPLWYNEVYQELGFKPLKKYRSDKFEIENIEPIQNTDPTLQIREFRDGDLKLIYNISQQGFDENFLYSQITYEEFNKLYHPLLPMIDSQLTVIAEVNGMTAGFMFSFVMGGTLVLKSMAVLPEFRSKGIGTKLINHVLLAAQKKGTKTAIAALISENNHSHKITTKYGDNQLREYTLYCLDL